MHCILAILFSIVENTHRNIYKQLDMKGIPFLLIVLIGVGIVYAYMYMQPLNSTVPGMREGMSGIPAPKGGPNPFVGPPPSGRPEDRTMTGESHEIPEGVLGEMPDHAAPVGGSIEGFQSNGTGCNPRVVRMTDLTAGASESVKPGALVGSPYGEMASTSPQYYRDPETETASRERIITTTAQLRGFLSFEAPLMRGLSDPAVQLPMSQAKADLPRLEQELYFLQQNPGLQSQLRVLDLDTVNSNINYLQQKYRLGVNTGLIQRPVSFQDSGISVLRNLVKGIEGFVSGSGYKRKPISLDDLIKFQKVLNDQRAKLSRVVNNSTHVGAPLLDFIKQTNVKITEEITNRKKGKPIGADFYDEQPGGMEIAIGTLKKEVDKILSMPKGSTASASTSASTTAPVFTPAPASASETIVPQFQPEQRASLADLEDAVKRLTAERTRLSTSGTNDPVLNARIQEIGKMIQEIEGTITQVKQKTLRPDEIPIKKNELTNLFANMGNTNMPLGQLSLMALPASAQNYLPRGLGRDSESQNIVADLIQKYTDAFLKGTSFEFSLGGKYTSENEVAAANRVSVVNVFPNGRLASVDAAFAPLGGSLPAPNLNTVPNSDNLSMAATGAGTVPTPAMGNTTDPFAYDPRQGGPGVPSVDARPERHSRSTAPAHFDWKDRAKTICENARKRGLNPSEFGCLPAKTEVSKDFSWRGYTKMICNRLMTNYYTGTDVACGCPPADWSGWNLTVPPIPNPPRIPGAEPASRPPPNF
jgi:hypothetical protein